MNQNASWLLIGSASVILTAALLFSEKQRVPMSTSRLVVAAAPRIEPQFERTSLNLTGDVACLETQPVSID